MPRYSIDTRSLQPGDIYIPVKGERFDGHDFIAEAQRKGAAQILDVELGPFAAQQRHGYKIPIIGVTGSAGKTSVKNMLAAVLTQKFRVVATEHNLNNEVGVPLTLLKIQPDTEIAVVEMALRHTGDLKRLAQWVAPTHAVITNIGFTHLGQFKNRDELATAKLEILEGKPAPRQVFINKRDDYAAVITEAASKRKVTCNYFDGDDGFAQNRALVSSVAKHFGLSDAQIEAGLLQVSASPHRLALHKLARDITLIDDSYNANPHSMRAACVYARDLYLPADSPPLAFVLGDMLELGAESMRLHQEFINWLAEHVPAAWLLWVGAAADQLIWPSSLNVKQLPDWEAAVPEFKKRLADLPARATILVKASRGIALDKLVAAVAAEHARA